MATIEMRETFQVRAPIDVVWPFLIDPRKVVGCMPGAKLDEVVDDSTFMGTVTVKIGAITAAYKGRVQLTRVDAAEHAVELVAEGREKGGGLAKGAVSSSMRTLADGQTEVVAVATVDLTGRVVQVGRSMIQGVSQQLFAQFAASLKQQLEVQGPQGNGSGAEGSEAVRPAPALAAEQPIRVLPLLAKALWAAIGRLLRRLLGRPEPPR